MPNSYTTIEVRCHPRSVTMEISPCVPLECTFSGTTSLDLRLYSLMVRAYLYCCLTHRATMASFSQMLPVILQIPSLYRG